MKSISTLAAVVGVVGFLSLAPNVSAASSSVYGALYQTAHLEATDGANLESVVTYLPGTDGFIAITTNSIGSEWWTSDSLGINWTRSLTNPLDPFDCTQPGRHSIVILGDASYFGADCAAGPTVFKITGLETIEEIHVNTSSDAGYPTSIVFNDSVYLFFTGGYTVCTDDVCTDVTDADGQPESAGMEAVVMNDLIYLPIGDSVYSFDGTTYTSIGEGYLEGLDFGCNCNLPAIGSLNGELYVGNQDFDNGATLFKYDPEDTDTDGELWESAHEFSTSDMIINKMQRSKEIDGSNYLIVYSSNADEGTGIFSVEEDGTVSPLVDSGLGGDNPTNNTEVVSIVNRTVDDNGTSKKIMLFSTQNYTDQTKIFVLNLDTDLAVDVTTDNVVTTSVDRAASAVTAASIAEGSALKVRIPKSQVNAGDRFILYVNGDKVDSYRASSKSAVTLKYSGAKNLPAGTSLKVKIGVKRAYGSGEDRIRSENIIVGARTTVKIK